MPSAIVATVGASTANSYGTLAEANTYFDDRPEGAAWTAESEDDRTRALLAATKRLDEETYEGAPRYPLNGTSTGTTQALEWPRWGATREDGTAYLSTVIPTCVKESCFELALAILDGTFTFASDTGLEGFENIKLGPLSITPRTTQDAGELPEVVKRKLKHVLAGGGGASVRLWRG